jgi:hypothetical protein
LLLIRALLSLIMQQLYGAADGPHRGPGRGFLDAGGFPGGVPGGFSGGKRTVAAWRSTEKISTLNFACHLSSHHLTTKKTRFCFI